MTAFLPIFPLQLVVYPQENLNLHIFEPRYKQLIEECEKEGKTFGIPAYFDGKIKEIGTELELLKIEKTYPKGEMDISTRGIGLFRIIKRYRRAKGKLYGAADVERMDFTLDGNFLMKEKILEKIVELFQILNLEKKLPDDPHQLQTYEVAHHVGFSLEQEYEFLGIMTEIERQAYLYKHLKKLIPIVKEMERLRERVKMNGHFKHLKPPLV